MPAESLCLAFGAYRVHPEQGLSRDDREVRLTPKALAVLCLLASRHREVVTKHELFAAVWPERVVTDAALSSCIRELRQALDDDAREPRFIETVHRRGFRFLPACTPASWRREPMVPAVMPLHPSREQQAGDDRRASLESDLARSTLSAAQPSIVVLPFESVSGEIRSSVIARGLVHDVITRLARSRLLLVIARGTAFQFANGRHDVRRVGRKLNVRYVVQGAVQLCDTRLKISVALADAASRNELWSDEYSRKLADFMLVQEEIAEAIAAALESEVQRAEVQRSLLMPSSNLDAWSAYHRGIHYMYRFRQEDCDEAERWFRRSIRMEPGVPRPYAGLSFVSFERAFLSFGRNRAADIQRSLDYALQSLDIDPLDPMAHWALSRANLLRGELQAAKQSLETAIDLNPSYAVAQYSLGWIGLQLGDNELCRDRVGFAMRLSPYDPLKFAMLGVYALNLALIGRTAEAAALSVRSTLQANVHHQALAFAAVTHALDGQRGKARAFFDRIRADRPNYDENDFTAVFPFQLDRDIRRVSDAFASIRTTSSGAGS